MTLVWRGAGLLVPITLIGTSLLHAWITGDTGKTLGHSGHIIAWGCLWTAIVCGAVGVSTFGNKDESGRAGWRNHSFFWIPMIAWAVIFAGLFIYLKFF